MEGTVTIPIAEFDRQRESVRILGQYLENKEIFIHFDSNYRRYYTNSKDEIVRNLITENSDLRKRYDSLLCDSNQKPGFWKRIFG